jgi:hypothetical protein
VWRRPVVAGVVLLCAYVGLSFLNSPRGFLGTDTGGKVATLEVMTRGEGITFDPDLGYWAERWDSDGSVYPIYFTAHIGRRWVNVTTLPMLFAAAPLYDVGGYRLALLLPMMGAVAAAFATRALVRRLGADERAGWGAFWLIGLASPLTIYALDFWEHSWGVALMAWGVVLVWDVVEADGRRWGRAAVAGALLGLSFTMRTETLVYVAVTGAIAAAMLGVRLTREQRDGARVVAARAASAAVAAMGAFGAVAFANDLLERRVLDQGIRGARATGVASLAGDAPADRITEAAYTLLGAGGSTSGVLLGSTAVALLAWGVVRGRTDEWFGVAVVAGAVGVIALRFGDGLGFVPGLFVAWPVAVAAIAVAGHRRFPLWVGAAALPVVVATQFRGGAAPQWAGRYVLTSGLLLAAVGLVCVLALPRLVQRAIIVAAVAVTLAGCGWLAVRSHDVDRTIGAIEARPEPVIVSRIAHLAREGGATYGERRWLTAIDTGLFHEALDVVAAAGEDQLVLVELADAYKPFEATDGWRPIGRSERLRLFSGVHLRLSTWQRTEHTFSQ